MKVLVLSCSTGEGHNSAAKAIQEEFQKNNVDVDFVDALSFRNKKVSKVVSGIFNSIAIDTPHLFGAMYKAGEFVSNTTIKSPVYLANLSYATKLYEYIISNKFDAIVCSHLFPMETLTYIKNKYKIKAKCYAVVTDYTCIPFLEETNMDKYFIGHEYLKKEFIKKGIPKDNIIATGIPVSSKFKVTRTREYARKKLKFELDKKIVMIMTGGVGCGNVLALCESLLKKVSNDVGIMVLVGKNDKLKKELTSYYKNNEIKIVDFTSLVPLYMDASDVLLTKPGGLSITEASVKNIPMIITMPIPGCETKNAEFFVKKSMALAPNSYDEIGDMTVKILNSNKEQERMIHNQIKQMNKQAAHDICDYILNDL